MFCMIFVYKVNFIIYMDGQSHGYKACATRKMYVSWLCFIVYSKHNNNNNITTFQTLVQKKQINRSIHHTALHMVHVWLVVHIYEQIMVHFQ